MTEPFQQELQAAVDAAETATKLDDRAAVALAGAFYKDFKTKKVVTTFGPGWKELIRVSPAGGYDGIAFHHGASDTLVILNRGTEGIKSGPDWMQNVGAALFKAPGPQLASALDLLVQARTKAPDAARVLICGHSLGGALADAQGALAASLFAQKGLPAAPVRVVGVASAGFAAAAAALASVQNLKIAPNPASFILHYVRERDFVPNHPGRSVFGREQTIASIFQARSYQDSHGHGSHWEVVCDFAQNHQRTLYLQFLAEAAGEHVWFSRNTKTFTVKPDEEPDWKFSPRQPDDW